MRDEERAMTTMTSHMKPQTHEERRTVTEELQSNLNSSNIFGTMEIRSRYG